MGGGRRGDIDGIVGLTGCGGDVATTSRNQVSSHTRQTHTTRKAVHSHNMGPGVTPGNYRSFLARDPCQGCHHHHPWFLSLVAKHCGKEIQRWYHMCASGGSDGWW